MYPNNVPPSIQTIITAKKSVKFFVYLLCLPSLSTFFHAILHEKLLGGISCHEFSLPYENFFVCVFIESKKKLLMYAAMISCEFKTKVS